MVTIVEGNLYQTTASFTDASGTPVDPTTVGLAYEVNAGTKVTLMYSGATVPAPGVVARIGAGIYVGQVDLTGVGGSLVRYWFSTEAGQAASVPLVVQIQPLLF